MSQTTYSAFPAIGLVGSPDAGEQKYDYLTLKNVEVSASMPFGSAVAFKRSSPASDLDALLPAASGDILAGLVVRLHDYPRTWTDSNGNVIGQLDGTGIATGSLLKVMTRGRILVTCQTGCAPGDPLFVSYGAATTYTAKGQLGNVTESSNAIDCTAKGTWDSTATAGQPAWLKIAF